MKNLITFIACIGFFLSGFSQITDAEYYIDTDNLGVGNQNDLIVTNGMTIDEDFTIPTTGLSDGLHVLHIRAKGTNNVWSLYKRAYFYVQSPTINGTPTNIVAAEYYIDTDNFGVGNQTALTVINGMTIDENFTIPTTSLAEGLHVLHIRVKDADNTWSLYKRAYFFVQSPSTGATPKNIVATEYYFDTDNLGVGNQNALTITAGTTINESFVIPTTSLTEGLHVLHIRVQDGDNTWSLYKRAYFYIHNSSPNLTPTPIIAAEYFFGNTEGDDPGIGNANALAVAQGMTINETFTIPVPATLTNGDYYLHIRVQDQDGTWSLYKRALFTADSTVSVEEFSSDDFEIFPNPVSNDININFKQQGEYSFSVFDISGKEIFHQKKIEINNSFSFSEYAAGIYILKIKDHTSNTFQNLKIVKY